jgi:O-antigen/teichoic acid export membrane protein
VQGKHDTAVVPILNMAGELIYALVVATAVARRFGWPRPRVDLQRWRSILASGAPLMVNGFSRAVLYSFDLLLIGAVIGRLDAGLYGAAYKPVLFFAGMIGLLSTAFLAAYSAAHRRQALELSRRTALFAGGAALGVAVAMSVAASTMMVTVFGGAYADAATAAAILAWTLPVQTVTIPYLNSLIAAGHQKVVMRHNLVAAAVNICANIVVIPLAGINGAALTTVASMILVLVLVYRSSVALSLTPPLHEILGRRPGAIQQTGN